MLSFGTMHCNNLIGTNLSADEKLLSTYYDAEWVYYQIKDYTGNSFWSTCAQRAEAIYRDTFVIPNNGTVPGYWIFPHGLGQDYLRTGDNQSRNAALLLAQNGSYAADYTPLEWTVDSTFSREVAYAIMSYLVSEDLGQGRRSRLAPLVDQAFGHLDQWFVTQNAPYMRPFMVALTSQALIQYYEKTGDSRVIPALTLAMDEIWNRNWDANAEAFRYTDRVVVDPSDTDPAPDLNLLIVPIYGFLYHETGQVRFMDRGDQIFAGGVRHAYLYNGKQFDQSYRWSFRYINWRTQAPKH